MKRIILIISMIVFLNSCLNTKNNCEISGKVILPPNSKITFNNLEANFGLSDTNINESGYFCFIKENLENGNKKFKTYKALRKIAQDISIFRKDNSKIYLQGTIFPDETNIKISSITTSASIPRLIYQQSNIKKDKQYYNAVLLSKENKLFSKQIERILQIDTFLDPLKLMQNKEYKKFLEEIPTIVSKQ